MENIIKCQHCGQPRPETVSTCPYCKPTATQITKNAVGNGLDKLADRLEKSADKAKKERTRTCLICNRTSEMKTWLGNNSAPQLVLIILLLFGIIPGLIFAAWASNKYKCPQCNTVNKNIPFEQI